MRSPKRKAARKTAARPITEKQVRRVAARVKGDSLATIAASEGCSKQAVAKSLAAPAVTTILGRSLVVYREKTKDSEKTREPRDLLLDLLGGIAEIALLAKRPVVLTDTFNGISTQRIEYVADLQLRLTASTRLLDLIDHPAVATRSTVDVEQTEEIVTRRTRARRTG